MKMTFQRIRKRDYIFLYAGDIPSKKNEYLIDGIVGLSINRNDKRHICHDITLPMPLSDCSVDVYQAEDVFEHIEYSKLVDVINEIYRVLKPDGYFRLSVPDYRCDIYRSRSIKNSEGEIVFDPGGGGVYKDGAVLDGGHVWFPNYEKVKKLIDASKFVNYSFLHYYDEHGVSVTNPIDYSKGFVMRTPDHDDRVSNPYRAMSIVVDMFR